MKRLILAAALSMSAAAYAQNTTTTTEVEADASMQADTTAQPSGETVSDPSQATGPQGVTQQGTDPSGTATPPAGTNIGVQGAPNAMGPAVVDPNQSAAFTPRAATQEYPPCSKTVTDGCIQTYERGVRRPRR